MNRRRYRTEQQCLLSWLLKMVAMYAARVVVVTVLLHVRYKNVAMLF